MKKKDSIAAARPSDRAPKTAKLAVIGGSGLYAISGLSDVKTHEIETPFGAPSDAIVSGTLAGHELLFLSRHGRGHTILPHEINARANICALKMLGAGFCLGIGAVGSLQEQYAPGDLLLPDQIIDRTTGRPSTFFGDGIVAHVGFGDPFCPVLRDALCTAARAASSARGFTLHEGGTYLCMQGPAFSTRAESLLYRGWGADVIGMTAIPEAKLAREAELGYASLALVTDYDCWRPHDAAVDVAMVLETMKRNSEHAKALLSLLVEALRGKLPSPLAADALACAFISDPNNASVAARSRLAPIIGRYLKNG